MKRPLCSREAFTAFRIRARVWRWWSRWDPGNDRWRARDAVWTGRSGDYYVGSSGRAGCEAGAAIGGCVGWRWGESWSWRDRLLHYRMLLRLLHRLFDFVLL